jgi:hypothetical protein
LGTPVNRVIGIPSKNFNLCFTSHAASADPGQLTPQSSVERITEHTSEAQSYAQARFDVLGPCSSRVIGTVPSLVPTRIPTRNDGHHLTFVTKANEPGDFFRSSSINFPHF